MSYYFSKNIARHKTSKIYNALVSYGYSAFSLTILEYIDIVNLRKDEAKKLIIERVSGAARRLKRGDYLLEQYYIDNILPEYNNLKTAGSSLGFKHSDGTLVKLKKVKKNESNPMFEKFHSLETKLNMSELKKAKPRSEETKLKIGLTNSRKLYIFINDCFSNKKTLFKSFDNYSEAAKYLNTTCAASGYLDKNKLLNKKWYLSSKDINN